MDKPKYTEDGEYRELEKICFSAGINIHYNNAPQEEGAIARAFGQDTILMPANDVLLDGRVFPPDSATFILGHEMTHCLINRRGGGIDRRNATKEEIEIFERNCDTFGELLWALAEKIAIHENRSQGQKRRWAKKKEQK